MPALCLGGCMRYFYTHFQRSLSASLKLKGRCFRGANPKPGDSILNLIALRVACKRIVQCREVKDLIAPRSHMICQSGCTTECPPLFQDFGEIHYHSKLCVDQTYLDCRLSLPPLIYVPAHNVPLTHSMGTPEDSGGSSCVHPNFRMLRGIDTRTTGTCKSKAGKSITQNVTS
jgi:hypothetical protein